MLFNSPQANTYAGATSVGDGTLDLYNGTVSIPSFVPAVAVPGTLVIGGANFAYSPVVRLLADKQISDTSSVTVNENPSSG